MTGSRLLVSVRSADEALAALAGGADLIDVKEPARGSLGRAPDATIAAVVAAVAGRVPVSAALGELYRDGPSGVPAGVSYVKWGLAGAAGRPDFPSLWLAERDRLPPGVTPVAVAYADWHRAEAPDPVAVAGFGFPVLLIDTFVKDGTGLRDHLDEIPQPPSRLALAGSLDGGAIGGLSRLRPDWFAVRAAACADGDRGGPIDPDRVRRLKSLVEAAGRSSV